MTEQSQYGSGFPLALTTQVTLYPGESAEPSADAWVNPLRSPIAIRGFHFQILSTVSSGTVALSLSGVDGGFSLGKMPITKGQIPLSMLGISEAYPGDSILDGTAPSGGSYTHAAWGGSWRLDYPIYLRPGEGISARFGHRNMTKDPITVYSVLYATPVDRVPLRKRLPYCAAYVAPAMSLTTGTTDVTRRSNEKDLVNELDVPVTVKRIVGRVFGTYGTGSPPTTTSIAETFLSLQDRAFAVALRESRGGGAIIKPGTPFGMAFNCYTRALETNYILAPKTWLAADIRSTPLTVAYDRNYQPMLSFVGYREVTK